VVKKVRRLRAALRAGDCDGMRETQIATTFDLPRDYVLDLLFAASD
jgi:hypothetical protein